MNRGTTKTASEPNFDPLVEFAPAVGQFDGGASNGGRGGVSFRLRLRDRFLSRVITYGLYDPAVLG